MLEIEGEEYRVTYDPGAATLTFEGTLRLQGMAAYAPITELLDGAVEAAHEVITLDVRGLKFLNSSGINILFRFVIRTRDRAKSQLVVRGTSRVFWQTKSLRNMQRLMPGLELEMA
jgi:hypothetical protein